MDSCFPPMAALTLRDSRKHSNNETGITDRPKSQTQSENEGPQGKIEILQDLDLYYIRQIAHNLKEYNLEQKIELEIKMREGTTRLLAACKHQSQTLEAAKSLLTSNERMSTYMAELQRKKKNAAAIQPPTNISTVSPSLAKISISDLRIPLIWRDTDHFKNKGDYRRFAVFCLVKIGTEICDTSLLCPVDRSLTDLSFPDILYFNHIPAEFECNIEVYSHILQDDLSIATTSHKIKKTIHTSISRTVGKKLAASLRDELNAEKIGPHFELLATARLVLDDAHDSIRTHDLVIVNSDKSHQLPLFGHFCCRLAALPNCVTYEICSGDMLLKKCDSENYSQCWGQLQGFKLSLWEKKDHFEKGKAPVKIVPVNRESSIQLIKNSSKEIQIVNPYDTGNDLCMIKFKSKDEQKRWTGFIVQHVQDHIKWKHTAENIMKIQVPANYRQSFNRQLKEGSLYDEIPLIGQFRI